VLPSSPTITVTRSHQGEFEVRVEVEWVVEVDASTKAAIAEITFHSFAPAAPTT